MPLAAWPGCFNPEQRLPEALVADFLFRVSLLFLWNIGKLLIPVGVRMGVLSRIGIALDSELLKRFDRSIERRGYTNRSEAFRDLIRDRLVTEQTAAPDATVVGTVTLIYDHHASGVTEKLTELQHAHHELVVSTSHAHLDHDSCLEVLIVHGKSTQVSQFADRLIGLKGVQHGRLVMTVPAHAIEHTHEPGRKHSHKQ
jgi:CopG family nickel-responsive transcriptional regulator